MCIRDRDNSFDAVSTFRYPGNRIDNEVYINTAIHDRIQIGHIMPTVNYCEAKSFVITQK